MIANDVRLNDSHEICMKNSENSITIASRRNTRVKHMGETWAMIGDVVNATVLHERSEQVNTCMSISKYVEEMIDANICHANHVQDLRVISQ